MKISELKKNFLASLSGLYPSEEIQSFFNILSEKYLGLTRLAIALDPKKEIDNKAVVKFDEVIKRLKLYEPIQYIIEEAEFYGLAFTVNKETLIPRPETEELVSWVLENLEEEKNSNLEILDIGTGSGCIAVSLAKHLPEAKISALDFSKKALNVAKMNAERNEVEVDFFCSDILKAQNLPKKYDIIVSNPPYVRELEKEYMEQNVLNFEPNSALYVSDSDPLIFYRAIASLAQQYLKPNGQILFEINEFLAEEMLTLMESEGFQRLEIKKDIYGKNRMLRALSV